MNALTNLVEEMVANRERMLREDVERASWNIDLAMNQYREAVKALEAFRAQKSGERADAAIAHGEPIF